MTTTEDHKNFLAKNDDMQITDQLTDEAILVELGQRVARQRVEAGLTQAQLAREAGVSKRTLERVEAGVGSELITLIRLLKVLKLSDSLNLFVPELPPSPIAQLRFKGRQRQRVGSSRRGTSKSPISTGPEWKWKE